MKFYTGLMVLVLSFSIVGAKNVQANDLNGYVTPLYLALGDQQIAFKGSVGRETNDPQSNVAAQIRLPLYESEAWSAGIAAQVKPHITEEQGSANSKMGMSAMLPFLSIQHKF